MWNLKSAKDYYNIDEITIEVFDKYKYALASIGVNFEREDVQELISSSSNGMEEAFQTTIEYWGSKKIKKEKFEHPSAFLIKALAENWKPNNWSDKYLENSEFKSPGLRWLEEGACQVGREVIDHLVADVFESSSGEEYILFFSEKTLSLRAAKRMGLERVLEYGRS